jgi:hypothetical protein
MNTTEVCKRAGIKHGTLRVYITRGLIKPPKKFIRTAKQGRPSYDWDDDDVARLKAITSRLRSRWGGKRVKGRRQRGKKSLASKPIPPERRVWGPKKKKRAKKAKVRKHPIEFGVDDISIIQRRGYGTEDDHIAFTGNNDLSAAGIEGGAVHEEDQRPDTSAPCSPAPHIVFSDASVESGTGACRLPEPDRCMRRVGEADRQSDGRPDEPEVERSGEAPDEGEFEGSGQPIQ